MIVLIIRVSFAFPFKTGRKTASRNVPVFHVPHITIFGTPHCQLFTTVNLPKIRTCTDKIASPFNFWQGFIFARLAAFSIPVGFLPENAASSVDAAQHTVPGTLRGRKAGSLTKESASPVV